MKTIKVDGRRHSRRVTVGFDTPEELWAHLKSQKDWQFSFPALIAEIKRVCVAIMRKKGLPHDASVFYNTDRKFWRVMPSPDWSSCDLEDYVAKVKRFERDSPEDLAARILTTAYRMERNPQEAPLLTFKLGEMCALLRVYEGESVGPRKGGSRTARDLKRKKQQRILTLRREALSLLALDRTLSKREIAETLADRTGDGFHAIYKLLPKVPRKRRGS